MSARQSVTVSGPGVERAYASARGEHEAELGRVALSVAQGAAVRTLAGPGTLYVRGFSGEVLYRVERDASGVILTFTLGAVSADERRES